MRWPIRNQILLPVLTILVVAVASTAISSAYMAARRSERAIVEQLSRVVTTLGKSNFPNSENVLEKMKGLSGAEFIAFDQNDQKIAATMETSLQANVVASEDGLEAFSTSPRDLPIIQADGQSYFAFGFHRVNQRGEQESMLVLFPESRLSQARQQAAWPPLVVGGITLVAMVFFSVWMAGRMGKRIRTIQQHMADIAAGDFHEIAIEGRHDEIRDLLESVNTTSRRLIEMQESLKNTERARLLGQLAGGLAHQLRNAVAGARMAVQIHQRRCDNNSPDDESLSVALRQLSLTEEQIKGLLSLGKQEQRLPVPQSLIELVDEIALLISPACEHANISFRKQFVNDENEDTTVADSENMRTALLNLLSNAIEASGTGGDVELSVEIQGPTLTVTVSDNGPGPPPELADRLTEIFVTGKQEGVGLGLAMVQQVAHALDGHLNWTRKNNRTEFQLTIQIAATEMSILPESPPESHTVSQPEESLPHRNPDITIPS